MSKSRINETRNETGKMPQETHRSTTTYNEIDNYEK